MFVSIDWMSFTFDMGERAEQPQYEVWGRVGTAIREQLPLAHLGLVKQWDYSPRKGRAPYNVAMQRSDNGVMVFAHNALPHGLVEVSGIGCSKLGGMDGQLALLQTVAHKLTRFDIAVDIFTETRPDAFALHRNAGRFKAWSEVLSKSGHTVYVGSKSSDRYARVYRYNEPHPRHLFLRVEHVLKAEQARAAAAQIAEVGIDAFVTMLGNTFGWQHEDWSPAVDSDEAAKAWRPERRTGKTVAWVYSQVIPALVKLHNDGVLDFRDVVGKVLEHVDIPVE